MDSNAGDQIYMIMQKRHLVFLSGYAGSGKDTVGAGLVQNGYKRFAFADELKDEVSSIYGIQRELMDTQDGKSSSVICGGSTVRGVLIAHGEKKRSENINHWVSKVLSKIQLEKGDCVITDWRFPNEYAEISRSLDPNIWNVLSVRIERWQNPPLIDDTETALDNFPFDHRIDNRPGVKTLHELRNLSIQARIVNKTQT